jgi:hypothetical protein
MVIRVGEKEVRGTKRPPPNEHSIKVNPMTCITFSEGSR